MTHSRGVRIAGAVLATGALGGALSACQGGRKEPVQLGYRGLGEVAVYDASDVREGLAVNTPPPPLPPAQPSAPGNWKNVKVLDSVPATEFARTMNAMTQWVAPQQGCGYCHILSNFASDSLYTKRVARQMLRMTRDINRNWRAHVGQVGVTCYSCHRGQPVPPAGLWYYTDENDYLRWYLDRADVRVSSATVGPSSLDRTSIKQTENTFALMINVSRSLGVNCTFCHNSRNWQAWQYAQPTRVVGLAGFRLTRAMNQQYLLPLRPVYPPVRLGPMGDAPKMQCVTCHQGVYKPLYGAALARYYPALWGFNGQWNATLPGDTLGKGLVDLRGPDSIPTDRSFGYPRRVVPPPLPAPTNRIMGPLPPHDVAPHVPVPRR